MSLSRQKNGRYYYQFDRIINGQRIRANKLLPKGWNQKQASEYDQKQTAKLYSLATGAKLDYKISDAVLIYLENHAPQLKGFRALQLEFEHNLQHYEGLAIGELNKAAQSIMQLDLSAASKRNYIANLRAACRYAWRFHGMGDKDPAQNIIMPKVNNKREHYATRLEMLKIAKRMPLKYRAFIRIAFYTGMRIGEILKANAIGDIILIDDTKNGESRIIPIHHRIQSACLKYLPCQYAKTTLQSNWHQAKKDAGFAHYHFHDLRHSTASELLNNGVDLFTIGKILGHKDSKSTQRYAHLLSKKLVDAINKIGKKNVV